MLLPAGLALALLALCGSAVSAGDLACRDALNPYACTTLLAKNSDGEPCCWCGITQACAVASNCSAGKGCIAPSAPLDPCANTSAVSTCGQCAAAQAGCGWCSAGGGSCASGTAGAPFAAGQCADPADNWWFGGACPAANQFFGVPLPAWFSLFTACVILVFGTGMTFVGYRLFKVAIVGVGIGASGVPAFLYTWSFAPDSGTFSLSTAVLAACVAAACGGFLCWRLFRVGVFIMGGSLGVILALVLHILVFARFLSAYGNTPLIVAAVFLGLGVGALGLRFMRKTMVVATSTLGAYAAIRGVSLFVPGSFVAELSLAKRIQAGETLPAAMDGYLGGIAALALAGIAVQFLVTARKAGKDDAKDELEKELEESELSLEALQGEGAAPPFALARGAHLFALTLSVHPHTPRTRTHAHAHTALRKQARRRRRAAGAGRASPGRPQTPRTTRCCRSTWGAGRRTTTRRAGTTRARRGQRGSSSSRRSLRWWRPGRRRSRGGGGAAAAAPRRRQRRRPPSTAAAATLPQGASRRKCRGEAV